MKPTHNRTLLPLAVLALVLLFGVIGCSRSGKVTGKVTYDGQTVPVGTMTFHPEQQGKPSVVVEITDGKYTAEKLAPGTYTITVSTISQRKTLDALKKGGGNALDPTTGGGGKGGTPVNVKEKQKDKKSFSMPGVEDIEKGKKEAMEKLEGMIDVPPKYADKDKSGLTVEIKSGSQEHDIDIPKG